MKKFQMKLYRHVRGKSDTDFFIDKIYLDNIHYNMKSYKNSLSENLSDSDLEIKSYNPGRIYFITENLFRYYFKNYERIN